jgi:hypothetical protein
LYGETEALPYLGSTFGVETASLGCLVAGGGEEVLLLSSETCCGGVEVDSEGEASTGAGELVLDED